MTPEQIAERDRSIAKEKTQNPLPASEGMSSVINGYRPFPRAKGRNKEKVQPPLLRNSFTDIDAA